MSNKLYFVRGEDVKKFIRCIDERFAQENQNMYCSLQDYNKARRHYINFMLGRENASNKEE